VYEVSPATMTDESFKSLFTFAAIELIAQLNLISTHINVEITFSGAVASDGALGDTFARGALFLTEQAEDGLRTGVCDTECLDTQLLLNLQALQPRRLLGHIGIYERPDPCR
jgi:hypothetical protein